MLRGFGFLVLIPAVGLCGCTKAPPAAAPVKVPDVIVATPIVQSVVDFEDFTGHTEAINSVDIRAQISGYLDSVNFKDGSDVKAGDVLFTIDSRTFKATLDQTKGSEAQAQAHLDRVTSDYNRVIKFKGTSAMSQEDIDRYTGDKLEAEGALKVATANRQLAETNLDYTRITAKFSGRISRRMVDPGNIVKANDTILTTLVALDPIYAAFDMDERTLLRIRRLVLKGEVQSTMEREHNKKPPITVQVGVADEEGFSLSGEIEFRDNHADANTGTLRLRALLHNPVKDISPEKKDYLLSPGLFIRVRVPIGDPHPAILVPDEALGSDQGQQYVYLVTGQNVVERRPVKTGMQVEVKRGGEVEHFRVIAQGLKETERVVTKGLQRVRPGAAVNPLTAAQAKERADAAKAKQKADAEKAKAEAEKGGAGDGEKAKSGPK